MTVQQRVGAALSVPPVVDSCRERSESLLAKLEKRYGKRQETEASPRLFQQQLCAIKVIVYSSRQMPRTSEMILLISFLVMSSRYMLYAIANIQVDQKDCGNFAMPIPP